MNSYCRIGVAALTLWLWAAGVSAQVGLEPGTRVRVFDSHRWIVGRIGSANDDAITLLEKPDSDPLVLPRSQVTRLEVSRRPSRRKKGALIGAAVGAAAGIAIVALDGGGSCPQPQEDFLGLCRSPKNEFSGPQYYAFAAALLGAAGAGVGALVAPGEKWEAVTDQRLHLSVGPARGGGVRFAASLRF
jgi:hypothetical protein